jgi:hypothetical protein
MQFSCFLFDKENYYIFLKVKVDNSLFHAFYWCMFVILLLYNSSLNIDHNNIRYERNHAIPEIPLQGLGVPFQGPEALPRGLEIPPQDLEIPLQDFEVLPQGQ